MFSSQNSQVSSDANFIEDVFSTYLYTGTGATRTITNGIDLTGKGGLVWIKGRSGATDNALYDTARGATFDLVSNSTAAQTTQATGLTGFGATGFSIGALAKLNTNAATYTSWTFREQPKFFDVVTYTGTGANRTIAHNLGSVPGAIWVKRTDTAADWQCYHRSLANTQYMVLNSAAGVATGATRWNSTTPTSTEFSLGTDSTVNASGGTYVAYVYAHDAGGFGLTGTDNVISCGSYTGNGSIQTITLGFEPQWLLVKKSSASGYSWWIVDCMRGMPAGSGEFFLYTDLSAAESTPYEYFTPTATGFQALSNASDSGGNYIYIAIRRGPMKVPTLGTSVFAPSTASGVIQPGITVDSVWGAVKAGGASNPYAYDRLRGGPAYLIISSTAAEASSTSIGFDTNNGVTFNFPSGYVNWFFRRAPNFFDEVCYTGTGVARTVTHNLAAVPELIIVKPRNSSTYDWNCYHVSLGNTKYIALDTALAASSAASLWNNTTPTSTVFSVSHPAVNDSGGTYIAYLFATCVGVSKVGSYTGTGALQTVACGFTSGARFVLIKRTDSTGDWYVWDSARGITSGNDPYLLMNSTAAEVTSTNYVDTDTTGFKVTAAAPAGINASGGTYIFLAIA